MEKPRTSTLVAASASGSSAAGRRGDHSIKLGQEGALVLEKMAVMQIKIMSGQGSATGDVSLSPPPPAPAPLTLSLRSDSSAGTLVDEEPDSPTSPRSCISPEGYTPLTRTFSFGEYGPRPANRELCYNYNAKSSCCTATSPAMDESIQPIQDSELPISGDLESDGMDPPDYSVDPWFAVRQATEFAEIALRCHNNDPSNEVKYELVKAIVSNYLFEGSQNFGHVNFTARAKQDDSDQAEQLFFAELHLRDLNTVTCFRSLKEKEDQADGCMELDTEAKGVDPEHCYACGSELKHPRDGASYQAGHRTGFRC